MKKIIIGLCFLFALNVFADSVISSGDVYINGKKVTKNSVVKLGDFIKTGKNSKVKFNIGKDAFLANADTKFSIEEKGGLKTLNVVTGGVLAVFGKGGEKHEVKTENMTAGIRGTGVYVEHIDGKSYFCTCYGETELKTAKAHKFYKASHHKMEWVLADGSIKHAKKLRGHDDDELRELEAMVGRIPPFDKK
ncbi:conserved hypothetical protein [Arcobacter nitrofigilis DSM 7299]|uniref:Uncharacterized protein n=1 Tax=Arcobacter nitrofigilis (strain ATCC 33309 / DSM 7299 / CCUG 15893 / LMG 7604 / NCTC 12251 / CI) TaxID=572480 RepID=D5V7R1_ARCNC|nr:FecR domain-containing protein [Arcobacter nitrofigilis]ADG94681.1 conserved hypothetical protein [Arcobacter nitrofigilis DSM 7299]